MTRFFLSLNNEEDIVKLMSLPTLDLSIDVEDYLYVDDEVLGIQSFYIFEDKLEFVCQDVGPSSNKQVIDPKSVTEICIWFEVSDLPIYASLFSRILITLIFNNFGIGVVNHKGVSSSQLRPSNYMYVK